MMSFLMPHVLPMRFLILLALLAASCVARADSPAAATSLFDPAKDMLVSEIKPGMKGYGLSVFDGTKIEKFEVEVISVLKNFNPKYDVILIRCHGQNLEHTGAIAGMSGSPIYLHDDQGRDRLIGAFAYGFPMAKDPIAGVQPIQYMLKLPTTRPADSTVAADGQGDVKNSAASEKKMRWSLRDAVLLPGMKSPPPDFPLARRGSLLPNPSLGGDFDSNTELKPLVTPLMVSGISSKMLDEFGPLFRAYGFHLLQAGTGGSAPIEGEPAKLEPGSVLAAPFITGDLDMVAVGTCTDRIGDNVFAFGHAFNNEGPIDIPMGSGQINGIVATLVSSFKLGSMTKVQGALTTDQTVGVAGRIGAPPPMIPMDFRIVYSDGSNDVQYHFKAMQHPRFTPLITGLAVSAIMTGTHDLPQHHTLDYDVDIEFENDRHVKVVNSAVNVQPADLFLELATPMVAAADNPFERVLVKKVTGTITVTPEARTAQILSVNIPKLKFHSGDTVRGYLTYRPFRAAQATLPIEFKLPKDLDDGDYQLVVSDADRYLTDEQQNKPFRFQAQNINDVFSVIDDLEKVRHNAVYLRLVRAADGVAVGRTEMPRLPASMRDVLLGSGRSDITPFVSSNVQTIPTQLVMNGSADFTITIDNGLRVEVGNNPPTKPEEQKNPNANQPPQPNPQHQAEPRKPSRSEPEPQPAEPSP